MRIHLFGLTIIVKRRFFSQNEVSTAYRNQQLDQYCDREKSRIMRYFY